jgi:hypothetical protein
VTKWIAITVALSAGLGLAGCKQGLGERCQVTADCDDGLTCSQSEPRTCGGLNQQQVDAPIPEMDASPEAAPGT